MRLTNKNRVSYCRFKIIYEQIIFYFSNFVNMPAKFNNKEPEYNRLSLLCGDDLNSDQILGEIVTGLNPVDELLHHLGGTEIGIGSESEIDDGLNVDTIIHDISSIRFTLVYIICCWGCFHNPPSSYERIKPENLSLGLFLFTTPVGS